MRYVVAALIALLVVLHQDFWNWHTYEPLILGFIPVGLAWHVGISLAAGLVAFLAVRYCWPEDLDPAATDGPSPRKDRS
ncbi:MAG: DUF3311 domain-containing protein [Phycisphaerae bacterium]|nr:DUF3311 domain-containing protein [Phycisphaerae bacterium]MCZ2401215.1 DUF3311 domain-containing protein [Phycisphaerae bacterium]NUQ49538.1 DUF3311 domain-containing protein [Phycisphaerae bacterium]